MKLEKIVEKIQIKESFKKVKIPDMSISYSKDMGYHKYHIKKMHRKKSCPICKIK